MKKLRLSRPSKMANFLTAAGMLFVVFGLAACGQFGGSRTGDIEGAKSKRCTLVMLYAVGVAISVDVADISELDGMRVEFVNSKGSQVFIYDSSLAIQVVGGESFMGGFVNPKWESSYGPEAGEYFPAERVLGLWGGAVGANEIIVSHPVFGTRTASTTVSSDGCHPITESVSISFE